MSEDITVSSGNVFADLEFDDPEEELAKAQLTSLISAIIDRRGLSEEEAAAVLGIQQFELSTLLEGGSGDVSTERLFRLLTALDHNVEIIVSPRSPSQSHASIVVHAEPEPAVAGGR